MGTPGLSVSESPVHLNLQGYQDLSSSNQDLSSSTMSFSSRSYSSPRTLSVYGAGGRGTRISSSTAGGVFGAPASSSKGFDLSDGLGLDLHVGANEKATMQNLNDRLASYLEKVRTLEKENGRLEKQIREWYEKRTVIAHDYSSYFAIINDLKDKISFASRCNAKTVLDIDNAKLAADDFKMKYENEQAMRLAVEAEVVTHNESLMLSQTELKELKSTLQRLQIELQSNLSMKSSLEESLMEIQGRYSSQLSCLQDTVTSLENQLSQLHANIAANRQDYDMLLDIKTRLEMEIAEYRRLLDGEDDSTKQVVTKVITVVETIVDGKVVTSTKTTDVDVEEIED